METLEPIKLNPPMTSIDPPCFTDDLCFAEHKLTKLLVICETTVKSLSRIPNIIIMSYKKR